MEKDEVPQEQKFTTSTQGGKELFSSCNDDSKKFEEFAPDTQIGLNIPEQVDALGNQEGSKDSIIEVDSNSRTSDSNETDESFEVISESSSPKSTSNPLCPAKDIAASEQPYSSIQLPKLSVIQSQFSSSTLGSTDTGESIEVLAEYSPLRESPVFHELNSKMSNMCLLETETLKEVSHHQVHRQQSQNYEHQKGKAEESEIFTAETSKEVNLEYEQMTAKRCKSSDSSQSIELSAQMKHQFVSGLSVATAEQTNNISEDLHEKNSEVITNTPQAVITGPSEDIIVVPSEETLAETVQNFCNSIASFVSDNEQLAVKDQPICGQDMKNSGSSMFLEVKSGSAKSGHEFCEQLTQHAEQQKVKLKESEISKTSGNGEEQCLNQKGTNVKKEKPAEGTRDKDVKLPIRDKFELFTSTMSSERNNQKKTEINERESKNVNTVNIQQKLTAGSAGETVKVIIQKQPGKAEVAANTNLNSDIKQSSVQKKFELFNSTIPSKRNKQKKSEIIKRESKNVNIANVQQKLTEGSAGEIAKVILQKQPEETEVAENTNLNSGIKQHSVQNKSELFNSTIPSECNEQKNREVTKRESKNVNTANIQQKLNAGSAGEITKVIPQKQPGETEVAANTNLNSNIKQHTVQNKFEFISTMPSERNEQKKSEINKRESKNANTANVQHKLNTDTAGEIAKVILQKQPGQTEAKFGEKIFNRSWSPFATGTNLDSPKRSEVDQDTSLLTRLINEFDENNKKGNSPCPAERGELVRSESGPFYEMSNVRISEKHLTLLLERMKSNHYLANEDEYDLGIFGYCKYLFEKDYKVKVVNNEKGRLGRNYPARYIVPYETSIPSNVPKILKEVTIQSTGETPRDRFLAPVIFWNKKTIYRSTPFMVRESSAAPKNGEIKEVEGDPGHPKRILKPVNVSSHPLPVGNSEIAAVNFGEHINERPRTRCRSYQKLELKNQPKSKTPEHCRVLRITNLVTDMELKLWLSFSSIEKIYVETINQEEKEFHAEDMPFPDFEIFRRYHENKREPLGLLYGRDEKDLVDITKEQLKIILGYFFLRKKNVVIHCISGWDLTPLFIALLRISLWAEGLIHKSLNPHEMAYLTLGYDWYLCGHNLPARLEHGEEIMHYCYNFLEHLKDDDMFLESIRQQVGGTHAHGCCRGNSERNCERIGKINQLKSIVLPLYDKHILKLSR